MKAANSARRSPTPAALAKTARDLSAAIDRIAELQPTLDELTETPEECPAALDSFSAEAWEPARDALDQAEARMREAMEARGTVAVVVRGRLYVDTTRSLGSRCEHHTNDVEVIDFADVEGVTL